MVLKDKIILITLQKKNIPGDVAFIILKYYKNIVDSKFENSEISSYNRFEFFFIFFLIYGFIAMLILLVVLSEHYILNEEKDLY